MGLRGLESGVIFPKLCCSTLGSRTWSLELGKMSENSLLEVVGLEHDQEGAGCREVRLPASS